MKIKEYKIITIILLVLAIFLSIIIGIEYDKLDKPKNYNLIGSSSNEDKRFAISNLAADDNKNVRVYEITASKFSKNIYDNNITFLGYNKSLPGPILRGKVGEKIRVIFRNDLDIETTIHWHGMEVPNEMDGVPDVTQNTIKPNDIFTYEFELKNSGVYWYHPHYDTPEQIERGLYGIIIVDDKEEIKTDKDYVYVLDDIRLDQNYEIAQFGGGHMDAMHGRFGNFLLINGQENYNISGKKGDLIRLRLVNTANARFFNFKIEDHKLLVIGEDIGKVEKPYEVDSVVLAPGQRYDVIVHLDNNIDSYDIVESSRGGVIKLGTLNYENGENEKAAENLEVIEKLKKLVLNDELNDFSEHKYSEPDMTLELRGIAGENGLEWTINNLTYPNGQHNLDLEEGKFYKLRFVNTQGQVHPMHIHGQKFQILSRDRAPINSKAWKDTVIVYGGETVDIGFIASGQGTWVNHCHILEHAEAGMLGTIKIN